MTQETYRRLVARLADYILTDDREIEDYERHCEENGLNPDNLRCNALGDSRAHIYAVASVVLNETLKSGGIKL